MNGKIKPRVGEPTFHSHQPRFGSIRALVDVIVASCAECGSVIERQPAEFPWRDASGSAAIAFLASK